jgi:hypothetical protein
VATAIDSTIFSTAGNGRQYEHPKALEGHAALASSARPCIAAFEGTVLLFPRPVFGGRSLHPRLLAQDRDA